MIKECCDKRYNPSVGSGSTKQASPTAIKASYITNRQLETLTSFIDGGVGALTMGAARASGDQGSVHQMSDTLRLLLSGLVVEADSEGCRHRMPQLGELQRAIPLSAWAKTTVGEPVSRATAPVVAVLPPEPTCR
ncbi:hypothetical protein [Streptomyces sp. NBC_01643]|uniref:hypothetical protein n=1 Tax=Streptomyces sp. NBC_01643 TaxID=2975906 RepID=UPI002F915414|nr:hypothetical protein OHB03_47225 [Streptomyces sp. NBC_01643]